MIRKMFLALSALAFLLEGCSPVSKKAISKVLVREEKRLQNHTGVEIFDLENQKSILSYRSDRYYTPASNTKILTLFAGLSILGDSVPSVRYVVRNDSVIFWGMGDPCFLNPECYNNFKLYDFLNSTTGKLCFSGSNFDTDYFGPGWAWDDYNDYYSVERSPLSIYGNTFTLFPFPDGTLITPEYFKRFYQKGSPALRNKIVREVSSNFFTYYPGATGKFNSITVPFHTDSKLIIDLLADTLHKPVSLLEKPLERSSKILYSIPVDSLYRVMMQDSDNHLAEQLLLNCSGVISDTLKPEIAIRFMQDKFFRDYPDKAVWKDGSGLSRYNLITPRFLVRLWNDIYKKVPRERLFSILAAGGRPGTLERWYKAENPFIFGKTGTLSNNYSLSGYLVTKSGKTLVFAFMNANHATPLNEVRNNMQRILKLYHEHY
jgi:D-alanyl-D-alanine carboxypeptidase/D-alanyl-D-alanine-endopeptidase (penicillin-binding protein 4)